MSCRGGSCSRPPRTRLADGLLRRLSLYPIVELSRLPPTPLPEEGFLELTVHGKSVRIPGQTTIAQLAHIIGLKKGRLLIEGIPLASSDPTKDPMLLFQGCTIEVEVMEAPYPPTAEVVKRMISLEVLLRTSSYLLQEMGKRVDTASDDWMPLIEPYVQRPLVRAFGYETLEQQRVALIYLRTASTVWPNDPDFRTIPFWVRANRARDTSFKVGEVAPLVQVHPLHEDGSWGPAQDLFDPNNEKPHILVAGSIT